jgi:hypothetical protein
MRDHLGPGLAPQDGLDPDLVDRPHLGSDPERPQPAVIDLHRPAKSLGQILRKSLNEIRHCIHPRKGRHPTLTRGDLDFREFGGYRFGQAQGRPAHFLLATG